MKRRHGYTEEAQLCGELSVVLAKAKAERFVNYITEAPTQQLRSIEVLLIQCLHYPTTTIDQFLLLL